MAPSAQLRVPAVETEFVEIPATQLKVPRVALGDLGDGRLDVGGERISASRSPRFGPPWIKA